MQPSKPRKPNNHLTKRLAVNVNEETYDYLKAYSLVTHKSMSDCLRILLTNYISDNRDQFDLALSTSSAIQIVKTLNFGKNKGGDTK